MFANRDSVYLSLLIYICVRERKREGERVNERKRERERVNERKRERERVNERKREREKERNLPRAAAVN
jgi:hypothetical protein